jgi:MFS family permease
MSRMFASLAEPNYRLWFLGGLVSNTGAWMQRTAQDWLVLTELTHHSGTATGIVTGLQFLPMLFLSPYAGLVSDRMDRLKLLKITQSLAGLTAFWSSRTPPSCGTCTHWRSSSEWSRASTTRRGRRSSTNSLTIPWCPTRCR